MSENGHLAHAPFSLSGWSVVFSFVSFPFQQEKVCAKYIQDGRFYIDRYDPVNLKKLLQLLVISFIHRLIIMIIKKIRHLARRRRTLSLKCH